MSLLRVSNASHMSFVSGQLDGRNLHLFIISSSGGDRSWPTQKVFSPAEGGQGILAVVLAILFSHGFDGDEGVDVTREPRRHQMRGRGAFFRLNLPTRRLRPPRLVAHLHQIPPSRA